jgi:hypothetical protein
LFNLIVDAGGWALNRDTFRSDRVLEYTSEDLTARFMPKDKLVNEVLTLPTLFMSESKARETKICRVGTITRLDHAVSQYSLTYTYDPLIPPIPNSRIEELAADLGIESWEFNRTHWAIKDADLFYTLLVNGVSRPAPKVFSFGDEPVNSKLVSVMMPFNARFNDAYAVIVEVVSGLGKRCRRADDIWKNDSVIQDVVQLIATSKVVICDLSGKNSNVFYETGIAHTLGKDVILITRSKDDVPFDLRHLRFIDYLNNGEGLKQLGERLRDRLEALERK